MHIRKKEKITPLPYWVYFWTVTCLSIVGLADSIYLAISHYRVYTDMGYRSFCAISKSFNCDTVSQSSYSIFFNMPVAIWGVIGYVFFLLLLVLSTHRLGGKKRLWTFLFVMSIGYSCYSIILAGISAFYIHSYCIMCIVSFGINFFLVYFTWLTRKRFQLIGLIHNLQQDIIFLLQVKRYSIAIALLMISVITATFISIPEYWKFDPPAFSENTQRGIDKSGHPWIGAREPVLTITEYADYQCFQCKKIHFFLRQLVAKAPTKIRLVHRHFPMDHRFNPIVKKPLHWGSGKMALLAIYAAGQGKFWEMNDTLFNIAQKKGTIDTQEISDKTGLNAYGLATAINNPVIRRHLQQDLTEGFRLGISGTPSFVVNGKVYLGQIPSHLFEHLLD